MARSVRDDGSLPVPEPLAPLLARGDGGKGVACPACRTQFADPATRLLTLRIRPVHPRKPGAGSLRAGLGLACGKCGHGTCVRIDFSASVSLRTFTAIASSVDVSGCRGTGRA